MHARRRTPSCSAPRRRPIPHPRLSASLAICPSLLSPLVLSAARCGGFVSLPRQCVRLLVMDEQEELDWLAAQEEEEEEEAVAQAAATAAAQAAATAAAEATTAESRKRAREEQVYSPSSSS